MHAAECRCLRPFGRLVVYARKMKEMAAFCCRHFSFGAVSGDDEHVVELRPRNGVMTIHPASKGQKIGQSLVKLVFDVEDVESSFATARQSGLVFGPVHAAGGDSFVNARDPSDHPISVSSRVFSV